MSPAWALPEPVSVREIENAWIVMPDGVRLAVQLWLPETAGPAPAVIESIPYRKRDSTRAYSNFWGRKLAQHGVAYARLDVRGSGDSEGLLVDEYLPLEQEDNAHAIAWLAAQPWCNGAVGMRGVSWGGFATLQAAALRPPALKAIMAFCSTDMRYRDDAHYVGGSFALTGLKWATSFKLVMAGPPDPAIFGPDWERAWMQRLEAAPPIAADWLSHQRNDAYWRQGSVGVDPKAIVCPAYLVGGWADPYNDTIPRLLERLGVPAKAVIGPWGHGYPSPASPGPGLAWEQEEVRWWRHWLAGEETGIMTGPTVWAYLPEQSPAQATPGRIPGRWVGEAAWPPAGWPMTLRLAQGRLSEHAGDGRMELAGDAVVGLQTPEWCPFSGTQWAQEQSADDANALVFDTDPLSAPVDLLGTPVLRLRIAADRPVARLAARLCEVTPDGSSWLVSYGALNLTHRRNHEAPEPLAPGVFYDVELPLYLAGRRFPAGARIRLALSESLWPLLWPSPEPVRLTLDLAAAALTLPVRSAPEDEPPFPIPLSESAPGSGRGDPEMIRRIEPDGWVLFREISRPSQSTISAIGTTVERSGPDVETRMRAGDPSTCRWRVSQSVRYRRQAWDCALESEVEITATSTTFHLVERITALRDSREVFSRTDTRAIPRDLM